MACAPTTLPATGALFHPIPLTCPDPIQSSKHCANRTHRLRSTLKMTHGKGRDFKKLPPITPENTKDL
ncbi:hypothetical protein C0992_002945, partial [Termitomyces sp. T32_za158]